MQNQYQGSYDFKYLDIDIADIYQVFESLDLPGGVLPTAIGEQQLAVRYLNFMMIPGSFLYLELEPEPYFQLETFRYHATDVYNRCIKKVQNPVDHRINKIMMNHYAKSKHALMKQYRYLNALDKQFAVVCFLLKYLQRSAWIFDHEIFFPGSVDNRNASTISK